MKTNKNIRPAGFTLVEIMIVVAIIGLLAAIAIPNFMKAGATAQTKACISNLQAIDNAKNQWALETGKQPSAVPVDEDIVHYFNHSVMPTCPLGGSAYILNAVSVAPACPNATSGTNSTHPAVLPQ